jgi:fibronectin-binding autotransporter adhesin
MKRAFAVVGLIVLTQGAFTRAQTTYTWIGGGDNSWFTAGHWNPAGLPDSGASGDTVFINNGGTARILSGKTGQAKYVILGDLSGNEGTVEVQGQDAELYNFYGATVGNNGTGTLTVSEGGYAYGDYLYVGRNNGSSGTMTITGKDSTGNESHANTLIYVGAGGEGTLNVLNGARVLAQSGSTAGKSSTGRGTIVVDGSGSNIVLNTFADMIIGDQGSGSLIIRNGGNVYAYNEGGGSDENFYVGRSTGGTGSVLVTGSGSRWGCNNARTYIGDSGNGTVTVENGADVANNEFTLGNNAGSKGELTLTGSGSTWGGGGTSYIGESGRGILTVEDGASLRTGDAYIAHNAGSEGSATVTGSGSLWQTGTLRVGYEEPGSLTIEDGGRVKSTEFRIGVFTTTTATVTGPGSRWETSGYGILSQSGHSTLDILNGGYASMQESWLGWDSGSSGTVNVDGAGSQWINSADMEIGHSAGQGTVNITGGGYASAKTVYLGTGVDSSGTAVVDGAGSQLYASNGLQVGTAGTGSLTVRNGGLVSVMNTVAAGSKGTVVLDDGTLRLNLAGGTNSSLTGTLSGNGALEKLGAGTLTLRDDSGYTGSITIGAGTVVTGANNSLSYQTRIDMGEQGTLSLEGGQRFASLSGAGTVLNNGWTLSTGDDTDTTFSGSIQGNGGFIKSATGSGTMTLTGKSTYTGRTYVNGGTLRIAGTDERLYDGGSVDIDSGGTFQVDAVTQTIGELTNLGQISLVNGGTLRLDAGQTYSGSTLTGDGALEKFGTVPQPRRDAHHDQQSLCGDLLRRDRALRAERQRIAYDQGPVPRQPRRRRAPAIRRRRLGHAQHVPRILAGGRRNLRSHRRDHDHCEQSLHRRQERSGRRHRHGQPLRRAAYCQRHRESLGPGRAEPYRRRTDAGQSAHHGRYARRPGHDQWQRHRGRRWPRQSWQQPRLVDHQRRLHPERAGHP